MTARVLQIITRIYRMPGRHTLTASFSSASTGAASPARSWSGSCYSWVRP
jgi:hypothetical protein